MLEYGDRWQRIGGLAYFNTILEDLPERQALPAAGPELPPLTAALACYDAHIGTPLSLTNGWLRPDQLDALNLRITEELSSVCRQYDPARAADLIAAAEQPGDLLSLEIKEHFRALLEEGRTADLPYDAEFDVDVLRAWVNCRGRPWQVQALLACSCSYQDDEFFVFLDTERQHYALKAPVLLALGGEFAQLLYGERFEHHAVYSPEAFSQLLEIAADDFNDLPQALLRRIKWRMQLTCGCSALRDFHLSFFNKPLDHEAVSFLVDTHPLWLFRVELALDWRGLIGCEVQPVAR